MIVPVRLWPEAQKSVPPNLSAMLQARLDGAPLPRRPPATSVSLSDEQRARLGGLAAEKGVSINTMLNTLILQCTLEYLKGQDE